MNLIGKLKQGAAWVGRKARQGASAICIGAVAAAVAVAAPAARAADAGVTAVTSAVDTLKADMSGVVTTGITFALVGMGALCAFVLVRKFMGGK
jgi:hypothetical protein